VKEGNSERENERNIQREKERMREREKERMIESDKQPQHNNNCEERELKKAPTKIFSWLPKGKKGENE